MVIRERPEVSRDWEARKAASGQTATRESDADSPWLLGALLLLAVGGSVFGLWLWYLILSGPAR